MQAFNVRVIFSYNTHAQTASKELHITCISAKYLYTDGAVLHYEFCTSYAVVVIKNGRKLMGKFIYVCNNMYTCGLMYLNYTQERAFIRAHELQIYLSRIRPYTFS